MNIATYDLKFTIASRTLFSRVLKVAHWDAFGKADTGNFPERLPTTGNRPINGYLLHSVEIAGSVSCLSINQGYLQYVLQEYPRYMTRFTGTFEEFLKTKSAKTRATLRRKARNFAKADNSEEIVWRQYSTPSEIADFLTLAVPLAERTYQARLFDGALPDTPDFHEQSIEQAKRGQLMAYLLFLEGNPVAYLYTPIREKSIVYAYLGYDERVASLSPGTVLQYLVHEQLFKDQAADYFDFTEGGGAHKALFATESTQCCNILYLNNTFCNRCLVKTHRAWNRVVEASRSAAEKLKLKDKIKSILR